MHLERLGSAHRALGICLILEVGKFSLCLLALLSLLTVYLPFHVDYFISSITTIVTTAAGQYHN